ncbi:hypothetical protein OAP14_02515 [Aliiglaciecola sp.]|nr:hypothetical protein [Aliiglaciecola sp.]
MMSLTESQRLDDISEAACNKVAQDIDATALLYGTPVVVVRDGKVIEITPKECSEFKRA